MPEFKHGIINYIWLIILKAGHRRPNAASKTSYRSLLTPWLLKGKRLYGPFPGRNRLLHR